MSDTNRFKTVTFSGDASFAVVRALRQRLETLAARHRALVDESDDHAESIRLHLNHQIMSVHAALAAMGSAA